MNRDRRRANQPVAALVNGKLAPAPAATAKVAPPLVEEGKPWKTHAYEHSHGSRSRGPRPRRTFRLDWYGASG